ncbi:MAG: hypothetical protein KatS3mg068_2437 [Candidatus Sericytochromatia bacterium]|nr:MAG: hypothetical protein KatS3mg068_2437 [Candidatus Sericytochromatia bacterium]
MNTSKNEKINLFFEQIKNIGFFSRLFFWKKVKYNLIEAFNEYKSLISEKERLFIEINNKNNQIKILDNQIKDFYKEIAENKAMIAQLQQTKIEYEKQINQYKEQIQSKEIEINSLNKNISILEKEMIKQKEQIENKEIKIKELNYEIDTFKAEKKVIQDQIDKFHKEETILKKDLEEKEKYILKLEKDISYNLEKIKKLEKEINTKEIEITKNETKIESYTSKILEYERIISEKEQYIKNIEEKLKQQSNEISRLSESDNKNRNTIEELKVKVSKLEATIECINKEKEKINKELISSEENKKKLDEFYYKKLEKLDTMIENNEKEKEKIRQERETEIRNKYEKIKKSWKNHEENVKNKIIEICKRHNIEYIERNKSPLKLSPDNIIKIADEYIIFDAKSPQNEDKMDNFPKYIEEQAKNLKKYTEQDKVKKDIFLVVPSNTIISDDEEKRSLRNFHYQMSDYRVFIVAIDSLEPIIINLKKIEEYEFVDKLSPDDRDSICRIIAKFIHGTKRKIQLDVFMAEHFINIIRDCENLIPESFSKNISIIEKNERINPPQDRGGKLINIKEIEKNITYVKDNGKRLNINIQTPLLKEIDEIPLNENH